MSDENIVDKIDEFGLERKYIRNFENGTEVYNSMNDTSSENDKYIPFNENGVVSGTLESLSA